MAGFESSAVREALDVGPPMEGACYKRATVTSTEIFQLPATTDARYWTFQAITTAVWIVFSTDSSITITTTDNSGLAGTVITPDVNTAYYIPAGQERSWRIPSGYYCAHISADALGHLVFHESSGDGNQ